MSNIEKIYEDEYILGFNKPSGLVVNRSHTYTGDTLQDYIEKEVPSLKKESTNEEFLSRSGLVHRLDKDTSGVLVVAKDEDTFVSLLAQFKERKVKKEYAAIVLGHIKDALLSIDAPIARNPRKPFRFAIVSEGKPAKTTITTVKHLTLDDEPFTYVSVSPETGRTHQIRVHLSALKHPVAYDPIYCTSHQFETSEKFFNRLMLHATFLRMPHPNTNESLVLHAKIPKEFTQII